MMLSLCSPCTCRGLLAPLTPPITHHPVAWWWVMLADFCRQGIPESRVHVHGKYALLLMRAFCISTVVGYCDNA